MIIRTQRLVCINIVSSIYSRFNLRIKRVKVNHQLSHTTAQIEWPHTSGTNTHSQ